MSLNKENNQIYIPITLWMSLGRYCQMNKAGIARLLSKPSKEKIAGQNQNTRQVSQLI